MVTAIRRALREPPPPRPRATCSSFLPGAAEIRRTADQLGAALGHDAAVDVHPLFGALRPASRTPPWPPGWPGRRKVVLATDIAETSLTVEGVRIVVDAGLARRPVFDAGTGLTRLDTVPASRASADQRAGRAGRLGPGVAVRLWSKVEHAARRRFDEPEIRQGDLAGLALELAVWGTEPGDLPFLDPPPPRALDDARRLLTDLGALDGDGLPTGAGREMVALPLHPRLARMVLAARDRGQGWLGCLLAALLEDRDVLRGRPDDLPADVGLRVALLADPDASGTLRPTGGLCASTRDRAHDLARRLGVAAGGGDPAEAGPLLALAYPDRIAQARGGPGRFVLRAGTEGWLSADDALAREPFLAVAEVDGRRRNGRIRIAAPLDAAQLDEIAADRIDEHARLVWDPRPRRPGGPGRAPARAAAAGHGRATAAGGHAHHHGADRPGARHQPGRSALDRCRPVAPGPDRVPARVARRPLARRCPTRPCAAASTTGWPRCWRPPAPPAGPTSSASI